VAEGAGPELKASEIVATARRLRERLRERFPNAGLLRVADVVVQTAEAAARRSDDIARPRTGVRVMIALLVLLIPASIAYGMWALRLTFVPFADLGQFVALFQSAVESLVFIGAGIAFLITAETRMQSRRALEAIHELRELAHLVDMHQLDKDPSFLLRPGPPTKSSPVRTMTAFELTRYLDYCCDMLALLGKIAALYGARLSAPTALEAVDAIESLTTGLSRKIWQKLILLGGSGLRPDPR